MVTELAEPGLVSSYATFTDEFVLIDDVVSNQSLTNAEYDIGLYMFSYIVQFP